MLSKLKLKIKKDSHFAELVKGSGVAFVFQILGMSLGYFFTLLVTRNFGSEVWGIFVLSFTVLQIFSVIGRLGMDTALLRFVADYSSQNKWDLVREVYLKALKFVIPFSLTLTLILFFLSPYIARYIFHKEYLGNYLRLVSIAIVPFVLLFINRECIRGLKKITEYVFLNNIIIPFLASLFLLLILIFFHYKEKNVPILSYIISIFISFSFSLFIWLRNLKFKFQKLQLLFSPSIISSTSNISYKYLLSVSIPMLLSTSMFLVMSWTDTLMLGIFRTEQEVGIYNVAFKVATLTSITLWAINTIAAPKFAEFWGKGDIKGLEKVVQQSTKLIFWTSFPILLIFWLFPSYILNIFGKEFKAGAIALIILTFGQFINSISGSVGYILLMTDQQLFLRNIIAISLFLNICFNIFLIPCLYINGAALASVFSCSFWNLAGLYYIYRKFKIKIFYNPLQLFGKK